MKQIIIDIVNTFEPISLQKLEEGKSLMKRVEAKYKFRIDQLPDFLKSISADYYALEINNNRLHKYESLYFDTDDFMLFLQHHKQSRNRYKVRYRHYADSDMNFFEIKLKNNKNITTKERIRLDRIGNEISSDASDFLMLKTKLKPRELLPKLWVHYHRLQLVNKHADERLTIDIDPSFTINGTTITFSPLVIAEVKQKKIFNSPFVILMKKNHIRPGSLSKYCIGISLIYDNIKKNLFKQNILSIKKLCHDQI
jgi:hypothetical protein